MVQARARGDVGTAGEGGEPAVLLKDKASSMLVYLMPDDHQRLRRMALDKGVSLQTLVMDGIDMLLAGEGQDRLERWETRRKRRR